MLLDHPSTTTNAALFDPDHIANPDTLYAALRTAPAPVFHEDWQCYLFTRYDQVAAWYKDKRLTHKPASCTLTPPRNAAEAAADARIAQFFGNWLVQQDPPHHTRGRSLMNHAFIPGAIDRIVPVIQEAASRLVDDLVQDETLDLVRWAYQLTNTVICTMIGLPESEWARLITVAETFSAYVGTPDPDRERTEQVIDDARTLFAAELAQRRPAPQDDVLSALMQAREGQEQLRAEEITALAAHLLFAGQETTTNALAVGVYELLRSGQWALLQERPDLLDSAVEEILRFTSPLQFMTTFIATEPITIANATIPTGSWCWMGIAAANRDPAVFPNPNALDVQRPNARQQIAFGTGVHYCLGASLARAELREALRVLLKRAPQLALGDEAPVSWRLNPILRGLEALPVRLG
jgi:cytochrome P450